MTDRQQVGLRIRRLREEKGCSREELSEQAGISTRALREIEAGKREFSAETLVKFSRALSVSCDDIMLGAGPDRQGVAGFLYLLESFGPEKIKKMQDLLEVLGQVNDLVN